MKLEVKYETDEWVSNIQKKKKYLKVTIEGEPDDVLVSRGLLKSALTELEWKEL